MSNCGNIKKQCFLERSKSQHSRDENISTLGSRIAVVKKLISTYCRIKGKNINKKGVNRTFLVAAHAITTTTSNNYIDETGGRLGDRFRKHLRDVERNDKDASKPVAQHFNLPNHSSQHMTICCLSLHQGNTDGRKHPEQQFTFQIGTLNPYGVNERFLFNSFILVFHVVMFLPIAKIQHSLYNKPSATHDSSVIRSDEGLTLETSAFNLFTVVNLPYQLS